MIHQHLVISFRKIQEEQLFLSFRSFKFLSDEVLRVTIFRVMFVEIGEVDTHVSFASRLLHHDWVGLTCGVLNFKKNVYI